MHAVGHAELGGQALQVIAIGADAYHRVMRVDALLAEQWQGTYHAVEALAALQAPYGKNKALSFRNPDFGAQVLAGEPRSKTILVDRWIDHDDASRIHAERAGQRVAREIAVGKHHIRTPEHETHQRELTAASPTGQLLAVGVDQHRPTEEPGDRPRHETLGQHRPAKIAMKRRVTAKVAAATNSFAYMSSDSGFSHGSRFKAMR